MPCEYRPYSNSPAAADRVKEFNFDGWAFASDTGVQGGIVKLLLRLKRMQEDRSYPMA